MICIYVLWIWRKRIGTEDEETSEAFASTFMQAVPAVNRERGKNKSSEKREIRTKNQNNRNSGLAN